MCNNIYAHICISFMGVVCNPATCVVLLATNSNSGDGKLIPFLQAPKLSAHNFC